MSLFNHELVEEALQRVKAYNKHITQLKELIDGNDFIKDLMKIPEVKQSFDSWTMVIDRVKESLQRQLLILETDIWDIECEMEQGIVVDIAVLAEQKRKLQELHNTIQTQLANAQHL